MIDVEKITIKLQLKVDDVPVVLDLFSQSIQEAIDQLKNIEENEESEND